MSTFNLDFAELKAYYKFNEPSGNLINLATNVDSFGSQADMVNSSVTQSSCGIIDDGYDYAGTTDSNSTVTFNDLGTLSFPFSVNIWVNMNSGINTSAFISFGDSSVTNGWSEIGLSKLFGSIVFTRAIFTDSFVLQDSNTLPIGSWQMLTVILKSNTEKKLYVNNDLRGTLVSSVTWNSNIDRLSFGIRGTIGNFNPALSMIDEASIWDRELTADEMTGIYNSGAGAELAPLDEPVNRTFNLRHDILTVVNRVFNFRHNITIIPDVEALELIKIVDGLSLENN